MTVIEVLFPEICNLYGDIFNVRYLAECIRDVKVIETHLIDVPEFTRSKVDMVYMGTTTEDGQKLAVEKLAPYMDSIRKRIAENTLFLITGNSFEVFGNKIINEDGSEENCLGLYDTVARRKMLNRYNSLFLGKYEGIDIVGYKSQFAHSYGNNENGYAFEVTRGCGLNPDSKLEGIRINNFISTYLLGPILVLNPLFTEKIIRLLNAEGELYQKEAAMKNYEVRLKQYLDPKTVYLG